MSAQAISSLLPVPKSASRGGNLKRFSRVSAEKFVLALMMAFGLWGVADFGVWWFQPERVNHWPLYLLLTVSIWFFIVRSLGYWFILFNLKKPDEKPASAGLTVDALTTAAPGEPIEMTTACLTALKNMTYPHETYLLDDSKNPLLKMFCQEQGIHYITRDDKRHAKCGNVNNGLRQSNGEFVLIVDPDHIVEPHYLDRVLGHFDDYEVGFVQTTQAYHNQDKSFVAKGGAEQTYLFYGPVMTGMGALGSNLVIGTNCTFRRRALESINLYKPGLAEDLHTSMALHCKGWKSVYVPEILARGLTPEDLSSFCHQQLKWSRGVLELLRDGFSRYSKGWSLLQRGLYLLSMSYYFESIMMAINLVLPLLYLWLHLYPANTTFQDFTWHITPWFAVCTGLFLYAQRWLCHRSERGLMWRGMLLQFLCFPIHLLGILYALVGKQIPYLPTAKVPSQKFPFALLLPQLVLILLTFIGAGVGLAYNYSQTSFGMLVFAFWNVIIISIAILLTYVSHQKMFGKPAFNSAPLSLEKVNELRQLIPFRFASGFLLLAWALFR